MQPRAPRLLERLAHERHADAADFDVHLQRGDSGARAGNLEIHVAVVIFRAGDVGEDRVFIAFDDQPHGDARARRRDRHAGVHQRQRAAANRGHRRGTVRFHDVGNEAHGVREIGFRRKQVQERAFGKRAMSDFAASGPAQEFHFADGKWREVVVQHEALEGFVLEEQVEPLLVFLGAQRGGRQGLRLAAREERRAVRAWQHAHFAGDVADFVEGAGVRAPVALQDVFAEVLFAQALKCAHGERALLFVLFRNRRFDLFLDFVDQVIAFLLRILLGVQSVVQLRAEFLLDFLGQSFVKRQRRNGNFVRLDLVMQFADRRDDALDLLVSEFAARRRPCLR